METRLLERRLRLTYVFALALIALLSASTTYVSFRVTSTEERASRFMESIAVQTAQVKRVMLLILALTEGSDNVDRASLVERLESSLHTLEQEYKKLITEVVDPSEFDWSLVRFEPMANETSSADIILQHHLNNLIHSARSFTSIDASFTADEVFQARQNVFGAESLVLSYLAELNSVYRKYVQTKVNRLRRIQVGSLGAIFIVLLIEGLFLFRPLVKRIGQEHRQLLRALKKAAEANEVKTEFISNVSHEIRTPLSAIMGNTEILLLSNSSSPVARISAEKIKQSSLELHRLITDLLDLSKVEADEVEINEENFSLRDLASVIVRDFKPKAQKKNLGFEFRMETPCPVCIVSDETKIHQVLIHLLDNAVKFTNSGKITICLSHKSEESRDILEFEVIDTGPGVNKPLQSRLFDAFYRQNTAMNNLDGGTGIGLTIAKSFAEHLGGSLRLVTDKGSYGCRFLFRFPVKILRKRTFNSLSPHRPVRLHFRDEKDFQGLLQDVSILLVEDGIENQRIINHFLTLCGAKVTNASDGKEGYKLMINGRDDYDIVLMDIRMPYMDGYTTTAQAKAAGYKSPIIALTAHAMDDEKNKCFSIGFDDYLAKPVEIPRLIETIAKHLEIDLCEKPMPADTRSESVAGPKDVILSKYHGQSLYRQLILEFADKLAGRVMEFKAAAETNDAAKTNSLAHKIKGAASTYGFPALSDQAARLEKLTDKGAWDRSAIGRELNLLEEICRAIKQGAMLLENQHTHRT